MKILEEMILAPGALLVPVNDLAPGLRARIDCDDESFALTRRGSRSPSKIVDPQTARLLRFFEKPCTIVDAVLGYSQESGLDPEVTLQEVHSLIRRLLRAGLLVRTGSARAVEIEPCLAPDEVVDGMVVRRAVHVLEDTEIYRVDLEDGAPGALKLFMPEERNGRTRRFYRCEAAALRRLGGRPGPRLLRSGRLDGRRYLLLEWCLGEPVARRAAVLRHQRAVQGEEPLARLCSRVLTSYVELHDRGVFHGDVHPGNVLVVDEEIRLIDFNLARVLETGAPRPFRGGIGFFFEPEYATAELVGRRAPRVSARGEQYAVAALIYFLWTGEHALDFSPQKEDMLRQIRDEPPLSFGRRGAPARPALEAVLFRALAKDPENRWPSMAAFNEAWNEATSSLVRPRIGLPADSSAKASSFLAATLGELDQASPLFMNGILKGPTCSVNFGAAGIAYGLYRMAQARDDAALLATADLWAIRAQAKLHESSAFCDSSGELTEKVIGRVSPYHTASGVHAVQALISQARGDMVTQHKAVDAFLESVDEPCENLDLTLGQSGVLLAAALLHDAVVPGSLVDPAPLIELGRERAREIWRALEAMPPIMEAREISFLGIAHGWAGMLYALLLWAKSSGDPVPTGIEQRLEELAFLGEPTGRGLRWPRKLRSRGHGRFMPTWCNGASGLVHLWLLGHRLLDCERFLELAERCAWNAWEEGDAEIGTLCCGLAGRAYSLLSFYRSSGEVVWLERAQRLADAAAQLAERAGGLGDSHSLYKGHLGTAVLLADLEQPGLARMPFFEGEDWRS